MDWGKFRGSSIWLTFTYAWLERSSSSIYTHRLILITSLATAAIAAAAASTDASWLLTGETVLCVTTVLSCCWLWQVVGMIAKTRGDAFMHEFAEILQSRHSGGWVHRQQPRPPTTVRFHIIRNLETMHD